MPTIKTDLERKLYGVLRRIAKDYQTSAQLRRRAGQFGLSHLEELEMAYENLQAEAAGAIRGVRLPNAMTFPAAKSIV